MTMNMTMVAYYHQGHVQGPIWRLLEENGYLISDNLEMNGPNVLYIYPGLGLGLYGHFEHGQMRSAQPVNITGM